MDWQPIETAPQNGTRVLTYGQDYGFMQWWDGTEYGSEGFWTHSDEVLADIDPSPEQPTHWMPLPEPPQ